MNVCSSAVLSMFCYVSCLQQSHFMGYLEGCISLISQIGVLQALFNGRTSMPSRSPQGQTIQLKGEIISMCQNVYGCRVVQRLLMYADQNIQDQIIEAVLTNVVANAVDTYSNYVIQHILVNGPEDAR